MAVLICYALDGLLIAPQWTIRADRFKLRDESRPDRRRLSAEGPVNATSLRTLAHADYAVMAASHDQCSVCCLGRLQSFELDLDSLRWSAVILVHGMLAAGANGDPRGRWQDDVPFLRAVVTRPRDSMPRNIYADWLGEHGRDAEAAWWRAVPSPA